MMRQLSRTLQTGAMGQPLVTMAPPKVADAEREAAQLGRLLEEQKLLRAGRVSDCLPASTPLHLSPHICSEFQLPPHTSTRSHVHTFTHTHMHTCTHAHMHTCTHTHIRIHTHTSCISHILLRPRPHPHLLQPPLSPTPAPTPPHLATNVPPNQCFTTFQVSARFRLLTVSYQLQQQREELQTLAENSAAKPAASADASLPATAVPQSMVRAEERLRDRQREWELKRDSMLMAEKLNLEQVLRAVELIRQPTATEIMRIPSAGDAGGEIYIGGPPPFSAPAPTDPTPPAPQPLPLRTALPALLEGSDVRSAVSPPQPRPQPRVRSAAREYDQPLCRGPLDGRDGELLPSAPEALGARLAAACWVPGSSRLETDHECRLALEGRRTSAQMAVGSSRICKMLKTLESPAAATRPPLTCNVVQVGQGAVL